MRPDSYSMDDGKCSTGMSSAPSKPAITATRLKGAPIMETRQVQVGTTPEKVLLELTPRAAETLLIIGQFIGGDSNTTRRGDVNAITQALHAAGVLLPYNYPCGATSGFCFTS